MCSFSNPLHPFHFTMRHRLLCLIVCLGCFIQAKAITYYSRASGDFAVASNWSSAGCGGIASGALPGAADSVVICAGFTMSAISNIGVRSVTVAPSGTLINGPASGNTARSLTVSGFLTVQNGGTLIQRSTSLASTSLFAGIESFEPSSTVRVLNWSGGGDPLIAGVNSNFGNLVLAWPAGTFYWVNDGLGSQRTILADFIIENGCATILSNTAGNISIPIGGKFIVDNSNLRIKSGVAGDVNMTVTDSTIIRGASPMAYGVYQGSGKFNLTSPVLRMQSGLFYGIYNGDGDANYTIGSYLQSGGDFRGTQNNVTFTAGIASFQLGSFAFTGGTLLANYASHPTGRIVQFNVSGDMQISYSTSTDIVALVRLATLSTTASSHGLNFTVGGNLIIGGAAAGEFNSNNGTGSETISITGNLQVSNGNNYFNVVPAFNSNGHSSTITIGGQMNIGGGNTFLSSETGVLSCSVNGNTTITAGTLTAKGQTGAGNILLNGSYNQSGGTFLLYNNATVVSASPVTVEVLGDFTQSGGTINYSNNTASTAINTIRLKGANYSLSGNGSMIRAGAGTASTFGFLRFNRTGTIAFTRTGTTHSIQQVKQVVMPACTVDVVNGNVQVASHATANTDYFTVSGNAVLNLRASQLFSNAIAANSGVTVEDNGRLRTAHPSGWYNNTTTAALNHVGAMNYNLGSLSVMEHYATVNQIMTGINVGLATGAQHKYGIVEVNQATPGTWVTPTNIPGPAGNVFARTELRLTQGVLNLANAAATALSGGRDITVENVLPTGITRSTGMIISETADFSGAVNWNIGTNTSPHTVPFAFTNLQLIPVVYAVAGGSAGTLRFSTYHTPLTNLPWPVQVNNLNSLIGLIPDNRDATADRFWLVQTNGSPIATLTLNYLSTELPIAPYNLPNNMRAQHYDIATNRWQPSLPGQTAGAYTVTIPSIGTQRIWTLSNSVSPLPVEWLHFDAKAEDESVLLDWSTASETGNDHFLVERSIDLLEIEPIGLVPAEGNTSQISHYNLRDDSPFNGLSYYRIRQVDMDGQSAVTDWKPVHFNDKQPVRIFPNPSTGLISLAFDPKLAMNFVLLDAAGRVVFMQHLASAETGQVIDLSHLSKGLYTACFQGTVSPLHQRLIIH